MATFLLADYFFVLLFFLVAFGFAAVPLVIAVFISPRTIGRDSLKTYESGILPVGSAWIQFGVSYYLFALIFLAFDVDVLFMFPVLMAYGDEAYSNWRDFIMIVMFLGILSLALTYAWCKGVFDWK